MPSNDVKRDRHGGSMRIPQVRLAGAVLLWAGLLTQLPGVTDILSSVSGGGPFGGAVDRATSEAHSLDDAVLLAVAAAAWIVTAWAVVVAAVSIVSLAAELPSGGGPLGRLARRSGRAAGALLPRIAPKIARRIVFAGIGLGAFASATACAGPVEPSGAATKGAPVAAAQPDPGPVQAQWDVDWPRNPSPGLPTQWALDWPTGAADSKAQWQVDWPLTIGDSPGVREPGPGAREDSDTMGKGSPRTDIRDSSGERTAIDDSTAAEDEASGPGTVRPGDEILVVKAGDSLWSIAAGQLPSGASDTEVDAAWHRLYEQNRRVIGSDPDLIVAGMRLTASPSVAGPTAESGAES